MRHLLALACLAALGCSSSTTCPPERPLLTDGVCTAASDGGDADGGTAVDVGGGDVGGGDGAVADDGGASDGGALDDAPVTCMATHPLVEGDRRYCNAGDCYCADPDACFSATTADACCPGAVVCESPDGGTACMGTHPLVEGDRRFCNAGDCYCADSDACFSTASAEACCAGPVVCG